jgi:subtilisin-like proprotein convertase family protein
MNFVKAVVTALVFEVGVMSSYGLIAQTNLFTNINKSIPDGDVSGVQDSRTVVSDITQITSARVRLKVTGNFNGDLYGYLRHSNGSTTHISVLLNRPGRAVTNSFGYSDCGFDVTFADSATNDIHTYRSVITPPFGSPLTGEWQPDARFVDPEIVTTTSPRSTFLSGFAGMTAGGEWTLFLADVDGGATNFLNSWGIEFTGKTTPAITWTNPVAIIYGTPLGIDQLNATAAVPGTMAYKPPAGTILPAGSNQTLSVVFTPEDTNSYVVATASVMLTIIDVPHLLSMSESPVGTFRLDWQVYPERTYRFQGKTNLSDVDWTTFGDDQTAGSSSLTFTNDAGTNLHRFFRALDVTTP